MKPIIKKALKVSIIETTNSIMETYLFYLIVLLISNIYYYFNYNYYIILSLFILDLVILLICFREINLKYKKYKNDEDYLDDGTHTIYLGFQEEQKVIVTIKNGKRNGSYLKFYSNGGIHIQSIWKNGLKDGLYQEFHPNGEIFIQSIWKNGLKNGEQLLFSNQGKLIQKTEYVNDNLIFAEEYYKNGSLRMKNIDENYSFFSEDKKKKCEILIDKISKTPKGVWINYDENQNINYTLNFDNIHNIKDDVLNSIDVLKTNYDISGNIISSKIIAFPLSGFELIIDVKSIYSAINRFNCFIPSTLVKNNPIDIERDKLYDGHLEIKLDPILSIDDLISIFFSASLSLY